MSISATLRLDKIRHPHHALLYHEWVKFRLAFEGGVFFKQEYLKKFSARETTTAFNLRKDISYVPAHAKAAIIEIRNSIYQRMVDITRVGGPESYKEAIQGLNHGVDGKGNSMNGYIGRVVLPELLVLGRVGVYIDKPQVSKGFLTLAEAESIAPYLYHYQAEDILSWHYDATNMLDVVLLRDNSFEVDERTGLITGHSERFRLLKKVFVQLDNGEIIPQVSVEFHGLVTRSSNKPPELIQIGETIILDLPEIPFTIMELSSSLMMDIADYQISMLNLASSDINYALQSNFPFYTEQYHPASEIPHIKQTDASGTGEANGASNKKIDIGAAQGRRYPLGVERPGFIAPSDGPLRASMDKQQQLKEEIRQLVNLNLSSVQPMRASADSKQMDNLGLEGGLAAIGLELAFGERNIGRIWAEYQGSQDFPTISYPDTYNLRTDDDRRREAKELKEIRPSVPSQHFQKIITKKIAKVMVGGEASNKDIDKIDQELEQQEIFSTDPEVIRLDHEAGFVSTKTASEARGYPEGEVDQAAKDHAERLARIAIAQSKARPAARGVADQDGNPNSGSEEKADSRNVDQQETTADRTRGEGQ